MRKEKFENNEYYHIYNHAAGKENLFRDETDVFRFLQSMREFNVIDPIGSIYKYSFSKRKNRESLAKVEQNTNPLVEFIAYCLNPNHYHFILKQVANGGTSEFMKRLGGGYSRHYGKRHERRGSLYEGTFKVIHIDTNEYLLHLSAYVNLNNKVHNISESKFGTRAPLSSWAEYIGKRKKGDWKFCNTDIVVSQFKSIEDYKEFASSSLEDIINRRSEQYISKGLLE